MTDRPLSSDLLSGPRVPFTESGSDPRCGIRPGMTPDEYDRHWIARVKTRCVITESGCWEWTGTKATKGYGLTTYRSRSRGIHRQMYQIVNRMTLSTEQYVLHRCDNRPCCNPDHLWVGTQHDNNMDCAKKGRHYEGSRQFCERGHPLFGDNVRIYKQHKPKGGLRRSCKTCEALRAQSPEYKAKARERQRLRRLAAKQSQVSP